MSGVYYNENDAKAAAWLRELIAQGVLPAGCVDERSVADVRPDDLTSYEQHHFFAGVGGWPHALELAGVPALDCWTGSCPCQPFSVAGRSAGEDDPRHLWPVWRELIRVCRPATIFGEQVASPLGRRWLNGVFADLEGMGYACAGADLCAASCGAPHIRQRLFWVAHARHEQAWRAAGPNETQSGRTLGNASGCSEQRGWMGDTNQRGLGAGGEQQVRLAESASERMGDTERPDRRPLNSACGDDRRNVLRRGREEGSGGAGGAGEDAWGDYRIIHFTDGKTRRIESGTEPLAHGVPARVVRLRGYGNAIVPQVAAAFIEASLEVMKEAA